MRDISFLPPFSPLLRSSGARIPTTLPELKILGCGSVWCGAFPPCAAWLLPLPCCRLRGDSTRSPRVSWGGGWGGRGHLVLLGSNSRLTVPSLVIGRILAVSPFSHSGASVVAVENGYSIVCSFYVFTHIKTPSN